MDEDKIMMLVAPYIAMIEKLRDEKLIFYFRVSDGEEMKCDLTVGHPLPDYINTNKYGLKLFGVNMCRKYVIVIYEHEDGVPVIYKFEL